MAAPDGGIHPLAPAVSLAAHGLVLGFALLGGWSRDVPPPPPTIDVTLVSASDLAAFASTTPVPGDAPGEIAAPAVPEDVVPVTAPAEAPPSSEAPPSTPDPVAEPVPEAAEPLPAPAPPPTDAPVAPEPAPPADEPGATLLTNDTPRARAADRVAPTPAPPAPPEAAPDEAVQELAAPSDEPVETPPADEATAPEEAGDVLASEALDEPIPDEITAPTESETPGTQLSRSPVPPARPDRPVRTAEAEPAPTPAVLPPAETPPATPDEAQSSAIDDLLAGLVEEEPAPTPAAQPDLPVGPPLTQGERDGLRLAVQQCWNIDPGSPAASVVVTVGFSLDEQGRVDQGSIRQTAVDGPDGARDDAFQRARRAILRCQGEGYDLPVEKFAQWRDIEVTFNPANMRLR